MIAVDTCVWVRYVTNDDPEQASRALKLLQSSEEILLPKTVLLELEWVLRAVYELKRPVILKVLLQILGLANTCPEQPEQVAEALDYYEGGLDLADALHLASCRDVRKFHTFDEKFAKRARALGVAIENV